jgi:antitoxin component YwqK of YwqJK toxin-antitoxin module
MNSLRFQLFPALLLTLAANGVALADDQCTLNGQALKSQDPAALAGKSGLILCKDGNKKTEERELKNGVKMGKVRLYQDGKLHQEYSEDEKGAQDGILKRYAPNGKLVLEENYAHGKPVGLRREWRDNGAPVRISFYSETDKTFDADVHYTQNTQKKQLAHLRCAAKPMLAPHANDAALCGFQGKPSKVSLFTEEGIIKAGLVIANGVVQQSDTYDPDGKLEVSETFSKDKRHEIIYYPNGNKKSDIVWLYTENGQPQAFERKAEFYENGKMLRAQTYALIASSERSRNLLTSDLSYYPSGKLKEQSQLSYKDNRETRANQRFFENGKLAQRTTFVTENAVREFPVGTHQNFAETGQLIKETQYDDEGNAKRERTWDSAGKLIGDDALQGDGSRKSLLK